MRTVRAFSTHPALPIVCLFALVGCAAGPAPAPTPDLEGPDYFSEQAEPDVVLGYFTEPKNFHVQECSNGDEPDHSLSCYGPVPTVTLVVQEVIFGRLQESNLELHVYNLMHPKRFPRGSSRLVLAYPSRQGMLSGSDYQRLVRTRSGEWAMPVGSERDWPNLPCSIERFLEPHAIEFARPLPTRALDDYEEEEIEQLESNPDVTIRNGRVEFRAGILLSEIYALRDLIPTLGERERMYVQPCLRKKAGP